MLKGLVVLALAASIFCKDEKKHPGEDAHVAGDDYYRRGYDRRGYYDNDYYYPRRYGYDDGYYNRYYARDLNASESEAVSEPAEVQSANHHGHHHHHHHDRYHHHYPHYYSGDYYRGRRRYYDHGRRYFDDGRELEVIVADEDKPRMAKIQDQVESSNSEKGASSTEAKNLVAN